MKREWARASVYLVAMLSVFLWFAGGGLTWSRLDDVTARLLAVPLLATLAFWRPLARREVAFDLASSGLIVALLLQPYAQNYWTTGVTIAVIAACAVGMFVVMRVVRSGRGRSLSVSLWQRVALLTLSLVTGWALLNAGNLLLGAYAVALGFAAMLPGSRSAVAYPFTVSYLVTLLVGALYGGLSFSWTWT